MSGMTATGNGRAMVTVNPVTGEVIQVQKGGQLALAADLRSALPELIRKAKERAQLTAVEKEWIKGESLVCVVVGRGEKRGPWENVILHRADVNTGTVGAPEERLCPSVLWNEIAKGLAKGSNTFYIEYLGRKASTAGGRSYHNFAVETLGTGRAVTVISEGDEGDDAATK